MQCNNCNALCMDTDLACHSCRQPLGRRIRARAISNWSAAILFVLSCVLYAVWFFPRKDDFDAAYGITFALFTGAATIAGKIIGWVIGAFIGD